MNGSRIALACIAMLSCRKERRPTALEASPVVIDASAPKVVVRFPLRLHTRYRETTFAPGEAPTTVVKEERLRLLKTEGARRIYESTIDSDPTQTTQIFDGDGTGYTGTYDAKTSSFALYDPPELIFPADAGVGMRWETGHKIGSRPSSTSRACEIISGERCADGLTSVCTTHLVSGNIVTQHVHHCDGIGYVGENNVVIKDGVEKLRLVIDGIEDLP